MVVDSVVRGRCIKQFARSVKKSAKSRLNPGKIARYTAKIVIQSVRTQDVKRKDLKERGPLVSPERAFFSSFNRKKDGNV